MEVKSSCSWKDDVAVEKTQQPASTSNGGYAAVQYPYCSCSCTSFLHQAFTALLNCLGLETQQNPPTSSWSCPQMLPPHNNGGDPPATGTTPDDPPSAAGDPAVTVSSVPQRPGLSTGAGGKTN